MRHKLFIGAAVAALMIPAAASAQETTSIIRGNVSAGDGSPVAGAEITVTHVPSGTTSTTSTDSGGTFTASGLRVGGPFSVAVDSSQGQTQVTDIYTVQGQAYDLPITLDGGGEEIVVTASSISGAGITSSGPQTVMTQRDISKVASVNRDIRDIERRDPFATLDLSNSRAVSFAGVNPRYNRFTINGVTVGDTFGLNPDASPTGRGPIPFDAIGQVSVSIAPYDFRQGGFQGGAIDTVLLSGTNEFHGTGFYSESRDTLQGKQIGSTAVVIPTYNSKTYGATLSGPIFKDKLFFMISAERNTDPRPLTQPEAVPGLTSSTVDSIISTASTTYGYDAGDYLRVTNNKDEKIVGKIDWNITDGQRLSLSYINAYDSADNLQNTSTSSSSPSIGLSSNAYTLTELLRAGIVQLNSDWTDRLSTEVRGIYRHTTRGQDPYLGRGFAQFGICTDAASTGSNTGCSSGVPRVFFGPDISRQTNALFFDTWAGSFLGRYTAGTHEVKLLVEMSANRTFNNFVQYSSGAYYFDSLASYNAGDADQLTVASPLNGEADGAAADFNYGQWTFGLQDDWKPFDDLTIAAGLRYDLYDMNDAPVLNSNFVSRYGFANTKTYKGLGNFQPRLSFNWKANSALRIRGGVGVFGGGSPDIYLSNSFSNTVTSNRVVFTRASNATGCTANAGTVTTAVCSAALNDVNGNTVSSTVIDYVTTNAGALASSNTGALDPNFKLPSVWKATLSADYKLFGFNVGGDYLFTRTRQGLVFTDLRSTVIGTLPDGRPRYNNTYTASGFSDTNYDILLTNTTKGRSHIAVVRFDKEYDWGLSFGGSYTIQDVKDVSNATSSTINSNYGYQIMSDPNQPAYGTSNDQTAWAFKYNLGYDHAFFGDYRTVFQLFGETRAGRPYSFTMYDNTTNRSSVFGTTLNSTNNARYLLYVPTGTSDPLVSYDSTATQDALNNLIDRTGLKDYRGKIAGKNIARSRAFTRIDLHLEQEIPTFVGKSRLSVFADIENLPNLINEDWGGLRQYGFPYTAAVVQVQCLSTATATGTTPASGVINGNSSGTCTQYRYSSYREPNAGAVSASNSLYTIRIGARFTF